MVILKGSGIFYQESLRIRQRNLPLGEHRWRKTVKLRAWTKEDIRALKTLSREPLHNQRTSSKRYV